jgi:hypothetical protein
MRVEKILHFRSEDASYNESTGFWTVNIPEGIAVTEQEYIRIEVINCAVPYSFYNINRHNFNVDIIESNADGSSAISWTLEFPRGNYNVNQFISIMESQLLNQSTTKGRGFTYNITYDRFTNTAEYELVSANAKTEFLFGTGVNRDNSLHRVMGFTKEDFSFTSSVALTTNSVLNMSPFDAVYIHSNLGITNSYETKSKNLSNILIKVPITSLPFSYIQWQNDILLTYASYRTTIQTIELAVKDMDGNNFNLNNATWYLSIKFIIEDKDSIFQPVRPDDMVNLEM